MVQNGRIPRTMLTTVAGQLILNSRAASVRTLIKVGRLQGATIAPPTGGDPGISGYRDLGRQTLFVKASRGDRVAAARCNMDPTMRTRMGDVGHQSHGWADRIDLLFDHHSPNVSDVALARRYSLVQEFGDDDRNHFQIHESITGPVMSDVNRIVCRYLNRQNLGRTSETQEDGRWIAESNFSWMLQEYGTRHDGWYPAPTYRHDGIAGKRTNWIRNKIMSTLWNS